MLRIHRKNVSDIPTGEGKIANLFFKSVDQTYPNEG
jgi:hypothetical protein